MRLLTIREAAAQIGVCEGTARNYIRQGRLLATRISSSRIRVSQAAIDQFIFNCTDQPATVCACPHADVIMLPSQSAGPTQLQAH